MEKGVFFSRKFCANSRAQNFLSKRNKTLGSGRKLREFLFFFLGDTPGVEEVTQGVFFLMIFWWFPPVITFRELLRELLREFSPAPREFFSGNFLPIERKTQGVFFPGSFLPGIFLPMTKIVALFCANWIRSYARIVRNRRSSLPLTSTTP